MFESLSERLDSAFKKLKGRGKLSESNIEDGMREVRIALLEADVHFKVVKSFIAGIKKRALGSEVMESLTPGQQVIKIVNEELVTLMGSSDTELDLSGKKPFKIMLVGLQGAGKTTTAGKLGLYLRKKGFKPYLVPADVYRPAAVEQLKKVGTEVDIQVYPTKEGDKPESLCVKALEKAVEDGLDSVIFDTAGRLQADGSMMEELVRLKNLLNPSEILLVADAMTGQEALQVASVFDEKLDLTGIVLSKADGDARGGAALSMKAVTGKPIKFLGVGEKLSALEPFYPERMASRILGMGDTLSLIEKAQEVVDQKKAAEMELKLRKNQFTLEDFKDQLVQVRKMGSIKDILGMLPGMNNKVMKQLDIDDKELIKVEAIINSMTKKERINHGIINGSRRKRIASGSGTKVQDVNQLLKNYNQTMKMMKKFNKKGMMKSLGRGILPF
ncbi:MAG: signal recognition particle protein [Desulforegulaceae bacterium]|jgi:signal recognition particle subunit SRP54|nr:signal recognition particle protein [Desulforegulaceae bacterium]